jgi:DNA-directed RNA polymerase alpha subunit
MKKQECLFLESSSTGSDGTFNVRLRNLNVSFVNAVRRTILMDIPTVVFKTSPIEENKCTILANTTRMNNEVLKHRLAAIPIFNLTKFDLDTLSKFEVEVKLHNDTDDLLYLTTEHFQIRRKEVEGPEEKELIPTPNRDEVFPINEISSQHIDVMLLRPKIENHYDGDTVHFKCDFSIGTAREDSNFNVVSHCAYHYKLDDEKVAKALEEKKEEWKQQGLEKEALEKEIRNFMALDAYRIFVPHHFDFSVQTIGVYRNEEILTTACKVLIQRLNRLMDGNDRFTLSVSSSLTMTNAFDITMKDEDYTVGKMVEYCFYNSLYENAKQLNFVGFVKYHPHDTDSLIRLAYKRPITLSDVKTDFFKCLNDAILVLKELQKGFQEDDEEEGEKEKDAVLEGAFQGKTKADKGKSKAKAEGGSGATTTAEFGK